MKSAQAQVVEAIPSPALSFLWASNAVRLHALRVLDPRTQPTMVETLRTLSGNVVERMAFCGYVLPLGATVDPTDENPERRCKRCVVFVGLKRCTKCDVLVTAKRYTECPRHRNRAQSSKAVVLCGYGQCENEVKPGSKTGMCRSHSRLFRRMVKR